MSTPKFHELKVKEVKKETEDCVSIEFEVPDNLKTDFSYIQGQYLTIKKNINGEELRRSYSICSSPFSGQLKVAVKQVDNGKFSTYANKDLKNGDVLDVMTPMGNFYTELNADNNKNYVAFASGSGITPVLSIIKATLEKENLSKFTLFYGNKNTASIIFLEEIEALKNQYLERFSVFHLLSRENVDVPVLNGRLDKTKCENLIEKGILNLNQTHEVFLCGPEEMINQVNELLTTKGYDKKQIHFELFTTPTSQAANVKATSETSTSNTKSSKVSVKIDGITYQLEVPYSGDTILDAALKTGADLPFACKGGVCCTCRAKVTSGTVDMDMNFALEDDEVEKGFVLTCQSHPTSDEVFVDFDIK